MKTIVRGWYRRVKTREWTGRRGELGARIDIERRGWCRTESNESDESVKSIETAMAIAPVANGKIATRNLRDADRILLMIIVSHDVATHRKRVADVGEGRIHFPPATPLNWKTRDGDGGGKTGRSGTKPRIRPSRGTRRDR